MKTQDIADKAMHLDHLRTKLSRLSEYHNTMGTLLYETVSCSDPSLATNFDQGGHSMMPPHNPSIPPQLGSFNGNSNPLLNRPMTTAPRSPVSAARSGPSTSDMLLDGSVLIGGMKRDGIRRAGGGAAGGGRRLSNSDYSSFLPAVGAAGAGGGGVPVLRRSSSRIGSSRGPGHGICPPNFAGVAQKGGPVADFKPASPHASSGVGNSVQGFNMGMGLVQRPMRGASPSGGMFRPAGFRGVAADGPGAVGFPIPASRSGRTVPSNLHQQQQQEQVPGPANRDDYHRDLKIMSREQLQRQHLQQQLLQHQQQPGQFKAQQQQQQHQHQQTEQSKQQQQQHRHQQHRQQQQEHQQQQQQYCQEQQQQRQHQHQQQQQQQVKEQQQQQGPAGGAGNGGLTSRALTSGPLASHAKSPVEPCAAPFKYGSTPLDREGQQARVQSYEETHQPPPAATKAAAASAAGAERGAAATSSGVQARSKPHACTSSSNKGMIAEVHRTRKPSSEGAEPSQAAAGSAEFLAAPEGPGRAAPAVAAGGVVKGGSAGVGCRPSKGAAPSKAVARLRGAQLSHGSEEGGMQHQQQEQQQLWGERVVPLQGSEHIDSSLIYATAVTPTAAAHAAAAPPPAATAGARRSSCMKPAAAEVARHPLQLPPPASLPHSQQQQQHQHQEQQQQKLQRQHSGDPGVTSGGNSSSSSNLARPTCEVPVLQPAEAAAATAVATLPSQREGLRLSGTGEGLQTLASRTKAERGGRAVAGAQISGSLKFRLLGMSEDGGVTGKGVQGARGADRGGEVVRVGDKRGSLSEVKVEGVGSGGSSFEKGGPKGLFAGPVPKKARSERDETKHGAAGLLALARVAQQEQHQPQRRRSTISAVLEDQEPSSERYELRGDGSSREHSPGGGEEGKEGPPGSRRCSSHSADPATYCRLSVMNDQAHQQQQQGQLDYQCWDPERGRDGSILQKRCEWPAMAVGKDKQPQAKKASWVSAV